MVKQKLVRQSSLCTCEHYKGIVQAVNQCICMRKLRRAILFLRWIISVSHCPRDDSCTGPIKSWCAIGHRQAVRKSNLSDDVREKRSNTDPEAERRYSLMKLEAFQREYKKQWLRGEIAPRVASGIEITNTRTPCI